MALETFKILNNSGPKFLHDLIDFNNNSYRFEVPYKGIAEIPRPRTTSYGKII